MRGFKEEDFKLFINYVKQYRGLDLDSYNPRFIIHRLNLRMNATHTKSCQEYINFIRERPEEFNLFLDTLSINVSKFFRDPEVFDTFKKIALKELINRKISLHQHIIRIWSCGCSCGEEAYSLAILMDEEFQKYSNKFFAKIWATDIDTQALEKAEIGEYELSSLKEMDSERLKKYFISVKPGIYQIIDRIKKMVKFVKHDIISDPPLKYMDIIFCRNLLIYLTRKQHELLFEVFNRALNSRGYLVIGKVESLLGYTEGKWQVIDIRQRIYQKIN
ncbi:MAG: protein-glutamate O-methyltransferase CheR [Candidatus Omnitrophica bacterium]|nr:protein-glutamate O-methyltransferase CheR [Candidatus Omnitrophota bacterium]